MKNPAWLFLGLVAGLSAHGADLAFSLMAPGEPVTAGRAAQVDAVALNPTRHEAPFEIEDALKGQLHAGEKSWPVTLKADGPSPSAVGGGGFAYRRFSFDVPAEATGLAILEVKMGDGASLRAVVEVASGAPSAGATAIAGTPLDKLAATAPASSALMRNFAGRFVPNQPVYFIWGGGASPSTKYQFSFDYRLSAFAVGDPGAETLASVRIGYTQRSLWDLEGESSPFYDTSYMPEFVVDFDAPQSPDSDSFLNWLGIRTGAQHESNGREGTDSRSLNIIYARPRIGLGALGDWAFVAMPEVSTYVGDLSDNPDIADYRGYGKLLFYIVRTNGPSLLFAGWSGKDFDRGSWQVDLSVPLHLRWLDIESFIYFQYFDGYGESLRDYGQHSQAFRAGFALVR